MPSSLVENSPKTADAGFEAWPEHVCLECFIREWRELLSSLSIIYWCKSLTHIHNYEHEQAPMVTDLHRRPVISFLCLGTGPGGVY
jgi:hypothetical protein